MKRGFTLIELVIYIGLMMILLPSIVLMLLQVNKNQQHVQMRTQMESTASIIFDELQDEIMHATSVVVSSSTFDSSQGSLVYKNADSQLRTFQYATDSVEFSSTTYNIGRLQFNNGSNQWLTSENIALTIFEVQPVRDNDSNLTALNIEIELSPLSTETTIDESNVLNLQTSIEINPSTSEE